MRTTLAMPRRLLAAVLVLLAHGTVGASAQRPPDLRACAPGEAEVAPCRTSFDAAPVLLHEAPLPAVSGEARSPHVWMYVDETGAVQHAQIGFSATVDWDMAAIQRAREYRFRPATLGGEPVPAWVYMPVASIPLPQTCADFPMSVPLSAGALFVDSLVFDSPADGTAYSYRSLTGLPLDVYLYPGAPDRSAESDVMLTIEALQSGEVRNGPDSIAIGRHGAERVRTLGDRSSRHTGYSARLRAWFGDQEAESFVAVFAVGDRMVKFRATHLPGRAARDEVTVFMRQILTNQAWRARGCPRER